MLTLRSSSASQVPAGSFLKVVGPRLASGFLLVENLKFFECSESDKANVPCQVDLAVDPEDDRFLVNLFNLN